jgi:hypothetical protein
VVRNNIVLLRQHRQRQWRGIIRRSLRSGVHFVSQEQLDQVTVLVAERGVEERPAVYVARVDMESACG